MASPEEEQDDNNNASSNSSVASNSQPSQISQAGLLPPDSQPSFQQQNQHNLMQQQPQRTPASMLPSNPFSHLNEMGQNSNMQQLDHMLSKASPLQLQILQQQQQQQQQQPTMQRKIMMGLGNVGMEGSAGNNMGQNPTNMNQVSNIMNVISQQLRTGMITPAQAAIMTTKLRIAQSTNMFGGAAVGQASNITGFPGSNVNMNQQQQPQMHVQQQHHQVPQQQESASPLQVGLPSMGSQQQQQVSPRQMSQQTSMSPQLSSGAIHPPTSSGDQEGGCS